MEPTQQQTRKRVPKNPDLVPQRKQWARYIAAQVRAARERGGVTQKELSEATGLSQAVINVIEQGETCPNVFYVQVLADHLGVTVNKLLPASPSNRASSGNPVEVEAESKMLEGAKQIIAAKGLTVVEQKPARRPRKTKAQQ